MKKVIYFLLIFSLISCRLSTDKLADKVKQDIKDSWTIKGLYKNLEIYNLVLVHKISNEYVGILTTKQDNITFDYDIDVVYDGSNMVWKINQPIQYKE